MFPAVAPMYSPQPTTKREWSSRYPISLACRLSPNRTVKISVCHISPGLARSKRLTTSLCRRRRGFWGGALPVQGSPHALSAHAKVQEPLQRVADPPHAPAGILRFAETISLTIGSGNRCFTPPLAFFLPLLGSRRGQATAHPATVW